MWRSHASLGEAVIIGGANIICRRQTSFKKRTFVLVDKSAFFVGAEDVVRLRKLSGGEFFSMKSESVSFGIGWAFPLGNAKRDR